MFFIFFIVITYIYCPFINRWVDYLFVIGLFTIYDFLEAILFYKLFSLDFFMNTYLSFILLFIDLVYKISLITFFEIVSFLNSIYYIHLNVFFSFFIIIRSSYLFILISKLWLFIYIFLSKMFFYLSTLVEANFTFICDIINFKKIFLGNKWLLCVVFFIITLMFLFELVKTYFFFKLINLLFLFNNFVLDPQAKLHFNYKLLFGQKIKNNL